MTCELLISVNMDFAIPFLFIDSFSVIPNVAHNYRQQVAADFERHPFCIPIYNTALLVCRFANIKQYSLSLPLRLTVVINCFCQRLGNR